MIEGFYVEGDMLYYRTQQGIVSEIGIVYNKVDAETLRYIKGLDGVWLPHEILHLMEL